MQPEGTVGPEFDFQRLNPEAAPIGRAGDLAQPEVRAPHQHVLAVAEPLGEYVQCRTKAALPEAVISCPFFEP